MPIFKILFPLPGQPPPFSRMLPVRSRFLFLGSLFLAAIYRETIFAPGCWASTTAT